MSNKLYLVKKSDSDRADKFWPAFDTILGQVICAESEEKARKIASRHHAEEGRIAWLDPDYSSCEELNPETLQERVILRDYEPESEL